MLPLILFNGMRFFFFPSFTLASPLSLVTLLTTYPRNISEMRGFSLLPPSSMDRMHSVITSISAHFIVSYAFGKLSGRGLGRRGCCAVAFITQAIAFLLIIFYPYHVFSKKCDYFIVLTTILLLACGDSVWESQVSPTRKDNE